MDTNRSRYGLLVSALGAIGLAVSVFLPWYGVSFTATGIALAQQMGNQIAAQFGNAALQGYMNGLHYADLNSLVGHQFATLSADQAFERLNVVLLIVAGLAIVSSLLPLVRTEPSPPDGHRAAIALLGAVAVVCVLYRMVDPPTLVGNFLSLSLREGAWLALLSSLAMVVGGLWPRSLGLSAISPHMTESVWSELSGWTPES